MNHSVYKQQCKCSIEITNELSSGAAVDCNFTKSIQCIHLGACLQTFFQRVQNYAMSVAINIIVSSYKGDEYKFAKQIGQEVQSARTGVASSAALIVTADWGIEYPQPMPPLVHVGCLPLLHQ